MPSSSPPRRPRDHVHLRLRDPAPLEARDDTANVRMFSGDTCGGAEQSFSVSGSGTYRCVPVSAARRSVLVTGSGCTTTTWSGTNCEGSRYKIPDSGCHSLLYGSVSVQC
ncbi:hypothetical protein BJX66DRAFT_339126 [Aspergillus keveii]|uniref:Uncharacterized protein n=1 Tax=Aspergillus keveii TaxID=714993 RepID=A0ABR4G230_9EURO